MKTFQDVLDKGITFSSTRPNLTPHDIAELESLIGAKLPQPYKDYLLHVDGGKFDCHLPDFGPISGYVTVIHWPKGNGLFPDEEYTLVKYLFGMASIIPFYMDWKDSLPPYTLMIGNDGGSGFYLIGFGPDNYGKIYAWRIVDVNLMENPDTVGYAYLGFIADGFAEFLLSVGEFPDEWKNIR